MASSHGSKDPPPPFPSKTRKDDIFVKANYSHVDEYVEKIPQCIYYGTLEDLVSYLTSNPEWKDMARLRAIFRWVTSADVFRLQHSTIRFQSTPPLDSTMNYIWKLQQRFKTVADLMADLCQLADIPCIIVPGMVKGVTYEIGEAVDRTTMGSCWNAVYVDGCWRLVNALWASSSRVGHTSGKWTRVEYDGVTVNEEAKPASQGVTQHRIDEFYFLTDPDQFIWSHFPDRIEWQLLEKPVTVDQFQSHFNVRSNFYTLGMSCIESTKIPCVVETKDGEVEFCFGLPPTQSSNYQFQYELYRSKSENDNRKLLDRFVMYEQRDELLKFALRFPIEGTFKLEISGLDVSSCNHNDWCCIYIVKCPVAKQKCLPLPDCPAIGWGPVSSTKAAGLIPVTHKQAEVVCKDGFVEIRLVKGKQIAFHQLLKHAVIDEATLSKFSVMEIENDEVVVYLRIPQTGEYALKIFAQDLQDEGAAPNVLNYLINCINSEAGSQPFPNVTSGLFGRNNMVANKFGVEAISHPDGILETKDGKIRIDFEANEDVEMVCEMHTNDGKAATLMTKTVYQNGNQWTFNLDMPIEGEYSLNVFAKKKGEEGQIYITHSYLIKSEGRMERSAAGDQGEEGDRDIPTETVVTSDSEVMIRVPSECEHATASIHRRNGNLPPNSGQVHFLTANDMYMVKVILLEYGEYMLNLYDVDEEGTAVQNVAKYQINRRERGKPVDDDFQTIMDALEATKPSRSRQPTTLSTSNMEERSEADSKRIARKNLQSAMDLKDAAHIQQAIETFIATGVDENDALLLKAKQRLEELEAKAADSKRIARRNLQSVMDRKDAGPIRQAIRKFIETGVDENDALLLKAKQQLEELEAKAAESRRNLQSAIHLKDTAHLRQAIRKFIATGVDKNNALLLKAKQRLEELEAKAADSKRIARRNLQSAMDLKDEGHLRQAFRKFAAAGVDENDALLLKAQQLLEVLEAKRALSEAVQKRDLSELLTAIVRAKKVNKRHEMDLQIALAERLKDHLVNVDKVRHAVLKMEQQTISEIRSYANPPPGVHECMKATFLLLGHRKTQVKKWRKIQALLGNTGQEHILAKIANFQASALPLEQSQIAKSLIEPFTKNQIHDVSAGAATFYIWAKSMIGEVESYGKADNMTE